MIHHIEIYVRNLAETRKFYEFLLPELGYNLYQEWEQGFSYKFEEQYIVFVQAEAKHLKNGYHRKSIGLNHLAFSVPSPQRVDKLKQELVRRGVSELYSDSHPFAGGTSHHALYFEDPDRIKIEIVARES